MDGVGFLLATAFLVTAYAVFAAAVHLVVGAVGEAREAVTSTMLGGLRAWSSAAGPGDARPPVDPVAEGPDAPPASPAAGSRGGYASPPRAVRGRVRLLAVA